MSESAELKIEQLPDVFAEITGRKPALCTVREWIRDGRRGVKLRAAGFGKFRFCRREWVVEFLEQCGNSKDAIRVEQVEARMKSIESAEQQLKRKYGIVVGGPSS